MRTRLPMRMLRSALMPVPKFTLTESPISMTAPGPAARCDCTNCEFRKKSSPILICPKFST